MTRKTYRFFFEVDAKTFRKIGSKTGSELCTNKVARAIKADIFFTKSMVLILDGNTEHVAHL